MPDRSREVDTSRTPETAPPDAIEQFAPQSDISDFAPTMKGGADAGSGVMSVAGSTENLLVNGGFEEGIGDWTPWSAGTSLSIATAHVSEGVQGLRLLPVAGTNNVQATSGFIAIPLSVEAVRVSVDVYFARVTTPDPRKSLVLRFYDDVGVTVGEKVSSGFIPIADSVFETLTLDAPVPAGATQFQIDQVGVWNLTTALDAAEAAVVDNCIVQPVPILRGLIQGSGSFPGGVFGMQADALNLTDTTFGGALGGYYPWGAISPADYVILWREPSWGGLNFAIEAGLTGRVVNAAAAARTVDVQVWISIDGGSTWDASKKVRANLAAAPGANSIPIARTHFIKALGSNTSVAIMARAVFTQINGTPGDCTANDGFVVLKVFPIAGGGGS